MTAAQRAHMARIMDTLVAHEPVIHYGQMRPMRSRWISTDAELASVLRSGMVMDCSESVTLICHIAGIENPSGLSYESGLGNVSTIREHCFPHYTDPRQAFIGALVTFGMNGHVTMVRHRGYDPILFTHGSERGPYYAPLSHLAPYLPRPYTFCSVAHL